MPDSEIPERLKRARGAYTSATGKEPTWDEVATAIRMRGPSISEIMNRKRHMKLAEARALARYFGVRAGWLAFGEPPMLAGPEELRGLSADVPVGPADVSMRPPAPADAPMPASQVRRRRAP